MHYREKFTIGLGFLDDGERNSNYFLSHINSSVIKISHPNLNVLWHSTGVIANVDLITDCNISKKIYINKQVPKMQTDRF